MISTRIQLTLAALAALAALLVSGCAPGVARIEGAWTAADSEGTQPVATFTSKDLTLYCIVDLRNAPQNTIVQATWTAVQVTGMKPNEVFDRTLKTSGSDRLVFELWRTIPWPEGHYKIDISLNGELDRTLEFDVQSTT